MTLTGHSAVAAPFDLTGTLQMRRKPTLLADATWEITYGGQMTSIEEIQTSKASYFKSAGLADRTGKPWFEISLARQSSWMTKTRFAIWLDGNHLMRKSVEQESVTGHAVTTTINVTAVNQPVTVALPPASEIAQSANPSS